MCVHMFISCIVGTLHFFKNRRTEIIIFVIIKVSLLHASLEQEKSKVKGLQSEQPKHHQVSYKFISCSVFMNGFLAW